MENNKKGISLITLIITILVVLIISGVVILNVINRDTLKSVKESVFKNDLKSFDEQIRTAILNGFITDNGVIEKTFIEKDEIKQYSPELVKSKYKDISYISEGVLTLRSNKLTEEQIKWAKEAHIKLDSTVNIENNTNVEINVLPIEWTNKDVIVALNSNNISKEYDISEYKLQYKIDENEWCDYATPLTVTQNCVVYGRLLYIPTLDDEIGGNSNFISNIDKTSPTAPILTATAEVNTIAVNATGSSDPVGCGVIKGYQYKIGENNWSEIIEDGVAHVFKDLVPGEKYLIYARAIDGVGNASESTSEEVATIGKYLVSYNANGGTGTTESQEKIHNETLILSNNNFTAPTDYTFDSWNTNADGSGTKYTQGSEYTTNADINLYARWFCAGTGNTCDGPFTKSMTCSSGVYCSGGSLGTGSCSSGVYCSGGSSYTCSNTVMTSESKRTCGTFKITSCGAEGYCSSCKRNSVVICHYTCNGCGKTTTRSGGMCTYIDCPTYSSNASNSAPNSLSHVFYTRTYQCSTHSWSGSSSSHTVTTYCSHSKSSSHYYCSSHGNVSSATHSYTYRINCTHGTYNSHYYCSSHGNVSSATHSYTYRINCTHGTYNSHYYCSSHGNVSSATHNYTYPIACTHSKYSGHYYCSLHGNVSSQSHTYQEKIKCTHGKYSEHSYCSHNSLVGHYK